MKSSTNQFQLDVYAIKFDDYIIDVAWSYDNKYICVALASGKISVAVVENKKTLYALVAHENGIISVAHSPIDPIFLTAGQDGFVKLWETTTGKLLITIIGGWQWVEHIQWSPDGAYFILGSGKHLKLFSKTGENVWSFVNPESTISALSWNKVNQNFAVGSYGNLKLFSIENNIPQEILPWKNSLISLAWSPDGNFVCAGTQDARIHFWPLPYIEETDCEMSGYAGKVKELSWNYNSGMLASNCGPEIIVWQIKDKKAPVGQKPIGLKGHPDRITTLEFSNKGDLLVSGDDKGLFLLWYPIKNNKVLTGAKLEGSITCQRWSPKDDYIAITTNLGELVLVDTPI